MEKSVRLKTWRVEGRREARTVEAINAAFVLSEAWNLVEEPNAVPPVAAVALPPLGGERSV